MASCGSQKQLKQTVALLLWVNAGVAVIIGKRVGVLYYVWHH